MSYMSELAVLAEEGGMSGQPVEEIVAAARDIIAGHGGKQACCEWANEVIELVNGHEFRTTGE